MKVFLVTVTHSNDFKDILGLFSSEKAAIKNIVEFLQYQVETFSKTAVEIQE
jgi:hypothetical protein